MRAVLQALFVTFLWSTSWVLIKFGLADIPPLTFAGLRYTLAAGVLALLYARRGGAARLRRLTGRDWLTLGGLGLLFYTVTQGSQFATLVYLPATTFSLLLNTTAFVVPLLAIFTLREAPSRAQWLGIALFLGAAALFFYPFQASGAPAIGFALAALHVLATSLSSVVGRSINRAGRLDALTVTVVSMALGALALFGSGRLLEPWPTLTATHWLLIGVLAVVNTALTFTLWNMTLRHLTASESNMINNTMLVQIAVLAWLFLGERLTALQIAALAVAVVGVALGQKRAAPPTGAAQVQA